MPGQPNDRRAQKIALTVVALALTAFLLLLRLKNGGDARTGWLAQVDGLRYHGDHCDFSMGSGRKHYLNEAAQRAAMALKDTGDPAGVSLSQARAQVILSGDCTKFPLAIRRHLAFPLVLRANSARFARTGREICGAVPTLGKIFADKSFK